MPWKPLTEAPRDGAEVIAGSDASGMVVGRFPYALKARFIDGKWCADFGKGGWKPYEPQPTHFLDNADAAGPGASYAAGIVGGELEVTLDVVLMDGQIISCETTYKIV